MTRREVRVYTNKWSKSSLHVFHDCDIPHKKTCIVTPGKGCILTWLHNIQVRNLISCSCSAFQCWSMWCDSVETSFSQTARRVYVCPIEVNVYHWAVVTVPWMGLNRNLFLLFPESVYQVLAGIILFQTHSLTGRLPSFVSIFACHFPMVFFVLIAAFYVKKN